MPLGSQFSISLIAWEMFLLLYGFSRLASFVLKKIRCCSSEETLKSLARAALKWPL